MIKTGLYVMGYPGLTFEERLAGIKQAGFDFVCLGMSALEAEDGSFYKGNLELCEKYGLPIDNVHLSGGKTHSIWAGGELGDKVTERYCREIRLCASVGVKVGIAHVTWGLKPVAPVSVLGLNRLSRMAECAEKVGFTLALENSAYPEHLHAALKHLRDCSSIGYCFDSGHRNAFAPNEDFLSMYGDRLAATHLQDNDGANDLHIMPLDGCVPWDEVAHGLAKTALARRHITAEVKGYPEYERPGMSAEEIRSSLSRLAIIDDDSLIHIEDGRFTVYEKLSYEEKLDRLHRAMEKMAGMIEACE